MEFYKISKKGERKLPWEIDIGTLISTIKMKMGEYESLIYIDRSLNKK